MNDHEHNIKQTLVLQCLLPVKDQMISLGVGVQGLGQRVVGIHNIMLC